MTIIDKIEKSLEKANAIQFFTTPNYEKEPPVTDLGNNHYVKSWLYVDGAPKIDPPFKLKKKTEFSKEEK